MRSRWLSVLTIMLSFFLGCISVSERMEQESHCGVRKLDSFIGIPFGARFPEGCDVLSYTTNKWDKTAWDFVNNRKIIDAAQIQNTVCLYEGKVYEVSVWLQNYTDQSYASAKEIDKESRQSYSFSGTTRKGVGNEVEIVGSVLSSGGVVSTILDSSENWSEEMFQKLIEILERKYEKSAIQYDGSRYVMPYPFEDCHRFVIPFEDGRIIIVENHYIGLRVKATDERMRVEKERQKEKRFIKGADAL